MRLIAKFLGILVLISVIPLQGLCADSRDYIVYEKLETRQIGDLMFTFYLHPSRDPFGGYSYGVSMVSFAGYRAAAVKDGTLVIPEFAEYDGEEYQVDLINYKFEDAALSTIIVEGQLVIDTEFKDFHGDIVLKKGASKVISDDAFANFKGTLTNCATSATQGFFDAVSHMNPDEAKLKCRYSIYDKCNESFSGEVTPFGLRAWIENGERLIDCYKFTVGYYGDASEQNLKIKFKDDNLSSHNGQYKVSHISPLKDYELIFDYNGETYTETILSSRAGWVELREYTPYEGKIEGIIVVGNADILYDDIDAYEVSASCMPHNYNGREAKARAKRSGNKYTFTAENLFPTAQYDVRAFIVIDGDTISSSSSVFQTESCQATLKYKATETTCRLQSLAKASVDGTFNPTSVKVVKDGEVFDIEGYTMANLNIQPKGVDYSNNGVEVRFFIDTVYYDINVPIWTQSPNITINETVTPTGILMHTMLKSEELELEQFSVVGTNAGTEWKIICGNNQDIWIGGLVPNKTYKINVTAYLKMPNGNTVPYAYRIYNKGWTADLEMTTPKIELSIPETKSVSASSTRVSAKTNVDERELNVGFQWKKYDAPASLKPSEGYGFIYDGSMEGLIKNLQSTSFYNVRTFYKDASDAYYYSEWTTFDPSDFSYFEPIVHTFEAENITSSSVQLKGIVLAGSDDIAEQGFEYWIDDAPNVTVRKIAAKTNVSSVVAVGQRMEVTVNDLNPGSEYHFRAYAKTDAGITYGDEKVFNTEELSGINAVEADMTERVTVEGYYNLAGQKSASPHKGFNIIRYTNGTTKKVILK